MEEVVGGRSARSERELRVHRFSDGLHKEEKMEMVRKINQNNLVTENPSQ